MGSRKDIVSSQVVGAAIIGIECLLGVVVGDDEVAYMYKEAYYVPLTEIHQSGGAR